MDRRSFLKLAGMAAAAPPLGAILLADRIVVMGNPPGPSVIDIIPVELARPRNRATMADDPGFRRVQERLMDLLRAEEQSAA